MKSKLHLAHTLGLSLTAIIFLQSPAVVQLGGSVDKHFMSCNRPTAYYVEIEVRFKVSWVAEKPTPTEKFLKMFRIFFIHAFCSAWGRKKRWGEKEIHSCSQLEDDLSFASLSNLTEESLHDRCNRRHVRSVSWAQHPQKWEQVTRMELSQSVEWWLRCVAQIAEWHSLTRSSSRVRPIQQYSTDDCSDYLTIDLSLQSEP